MASSQPRTLRKRNVRVSYKNTCGSPAPRTSLQGRSNTSIALSTKVKTGSKPVHTGTLLYTVTGDRITQGSVSGVISQLFFSLMNYLVVQWLPRWRKHCNLYNM